MYAKQTRCSRTISKRVQKRVTQQERKETIHFKGSFFLNEMLDRFRPQILKVFLSQTLCVVKGCHTNWGGGSTE